MIDAQKIANIIEGGLHRYAFGFGEAHEIAAEVTATLVDYLVTDALDEEK